ncbi:MAG: hypothetical protein Q7R93_02035, partial [bacterium]|nr:hypothetical protein [bacterium]
SISTAKGADDGITFSDQIDLVIERNIISNIWDCGIEGGGDIKQGSIVANSIKNAGLCGIGSWYDSSIETTTFADNLVEDSPRIFQFRWVKAIKEPTTILFKDNIFRNNKITNPRLNKQSGGYDDDMFNFTGVKGLIATNNIFSGNDFSKQRHAPYMDPGTLAVDGGTNICKPLGPGFNTSNSPLKCQSSAGTGEAGGVNPSIITTPTITGSSAGAGKVYGGKATISAVVTNTTSGAFETFPGMLQYSSDGVLWHDSLTFDIPTLPAGARADITYTWTVNTGIWWFRICARGICSPESRIEVVARPGDASTPPLSSGKAVIVSSRPVISGRQNGAGKLYEGSMTFAAKVTNIGDGVSRAFKALLQYSKDDVYWSDWVQIDLPPLGPTDTSDINYSWNGGEGLWFVRACDDISDECSASTRFEVVAI